MKRCTICKVEKPIVEFNRKQAAKDGLQPQCKECGKALSKERYRTNKSQHRTQVKANKKRYIERNKQYVRELREAALCADCGENPHFAAMDFDHLDDKIDCVSSMVLTPVSMKKLKAEIDKCEIVCSNCHRIRTYERSMGV